ncbi:Synaptobrevin, partial [Anabarilius grahami]
PKQNGQSRLQQAQEDVEEVKVIMLDNINKTEERSEKLKELDDRADKLLQQVKLCDKFVKTATKVKQKKRWENIKYKVIIGAVVAAVILGIIVIVAVNLSGSDDSQNTSQATQSTKAPGDG